MVSIVVAVLGVEVRVCEAWKQEAVNAKHECDPCGLGEDMNEARTSKQAILTLMACAPSRLGSTGCGGPP
jgi:hypothetical protein